MIQINVNNKYMTFWDKKDYKLVGFEKSERKNKMYNAILKSKFGLYHRVPLGDKRFEIFRDKTGLNLYPHLIHNDEERRKNYRKRHQVYLKEGYLACEQAHLLGWGASTKSWREEWGEVK